MHSFTKDHIIPRSYDGPSFLENYTTMCRSCNYFKANQIPHERITDVLAALQAAHPDFVISDRLREAMEAV